MLASTLDWISAIIQAVGLVSIILVLWQIRNHNKWKRLEFTMNDNWQKTIIKNVCDINEIKLKKGIRKIDLDVITRETIERIINDDELYDCLNDYLNNLEEIACMCNIGAMHNKYAYAKFSSNIIFAFEYYRPFIEAIRIKEKDSLLFFELQKLYKKWKSRDVQDKQKEERLQEKFERKRERMQGK